MRKEANIESRTTKKKKKKKKIPFTRYFHVKKAPLTNNR